MNPFFSIIIPVYNVAPYLRECLDSVLNQTYGGWEAICVDDGSDDGSGVILDEYAMRDSRFRVIHKENNGVSAARNVALDVAKGSWIVFLDSDDLLRDNALIALAKKVENINDAEIITFKFLRFFGSSAKILWPTKEEKSERVVDIRTEVPILELYWGFCEKIYRREFLSNIRFKPFKRGEDVLFLAECLGKARKVIMTKEHLYGYRQRQNSATKTKIDRNSIEEKFQWYLELFDLYHKMEKKISRRRLSDLFSSMASQIPVQICKSNLADQHHLWNGWHDMLSELKNRGLTCVFSLSQRFFVKWNIKTRNPSLALLSAMPFCLGVRDRVSLLCALIKRGKSSARNLLNRSLLYCASKGRLSGGGVYLIGLPTIEICNGGKVVIGNGCILRSSNRGYHANLLGPVKLKVSRPNAMISIGDYSRIYGTSMNAFNSITIGSHVLIAGNCQIFDSNGHMPSWENLDERGDSKDDGCPIVIEDYVWLGLGCIVLPGVRIGRGSIIGAGSVVSKDIPPMSVAAGNPIRIFKSIVS